MRLKEAAKVAGGILLAVVLLWWVLRRTDTAVLWYHLRSASLPGLALAAALSIGHNVFRILRWRALLEPVRSKVPIRPMFDAVILGYMTTWCIPGRLGELVRPALLSARERLPLGPCLGSVVADRLFDGMAVLMLFIVGVLATPLSGESVRHVELIRAGAIGLVGVISVPLLMLLVASTARGRLERMFAGRRGIRGWLGRTLLSLSEGVVALKRPGLLIRIVVHTALAWLVIALSTWVGLRASGVHISFTGSLMLHPLLALGIALPTPGGAGGYHAAMRIGLIQLFAVDEPIAVGAGLLIHAAAILPVILVGSALLLVGGMRFQDLLEAARQVRGLGSSGGAGAPLGRPAEKTS